MYLAMQRLVPNGRHKTRKIPVSENSLRSWLTVQDVGDDLNTHFPVIGKKFIEEGKISQSKIGKALCGLMSSKELVDFSVNYFKSIFSE